MSNDPKWRGPKTNDPKERKTGGPISMDSNLTFKIEKKLKQSKTHSESVLNSQWMLKIRIQIQSFRSGNPFHVDSNPIPLSSLSVTSNENFLLNRF
jgi:hypothetical protein